MSEVQIRKYGVLGHITLSRPKYLNSLTIEMVKKIEFALDEWQFDKEVVAVVIDALGEKAFCAGGDILELYDQGKRGNFEYGKNFWRLEYRLNAKIANYRKPFVSLMQGFTMGGGVGISCHGSYRIVSEDTVIALPECGIGLVPDVGGSYLLCKAPKGVGIYLGITGTRMTAGDAIYCKFADYFIPRNHWSKVICGIANNGEVEKTIKKYALTPPNSGLEELTPTIQKVMKNNDLNSLYKSMSTESKLKDGFKRLKNNSPLSIAFTNKMLRMPETAKNIESALEIEYRFTSRAQEMTDFQEGVRALVIDKDKKPIWKHKSLGLVTKEELDELFVPIDEEAERRLE